MFDKLFEKLEPGYRAPDRRTIRKRIHNHDHEYINELKQLLSKDRRIAFTTDIWKSPKRDHFICLTAHVFNDELKPVSLLLSFRRLTNRKLGENLHEFITYELNRFGLLNCSHAGITTDNASDIRAATEFGDFSPRFPCIAYILNLVINHGLCIWESPNENRNKKQNNNNKDIIVLHDADASSLLPTAVPADEEYDDSLPNFSSSTNDENNQILKALHKTHALVVRTRKLVKLMRNVSAIDQYVRNHQDGPKNGFVIDIR
ncbi:unnamed protein product, partial [Rotaria sp. Silwood1]